MEWFDKGFDQKPCRYDSCSYLFQLCEEPRYRLLPAFLHGHLFLLHKVLSTKKTGYLTPSPGSSQGSAVSWSTYLQPFKPECWLVLAGAVLVCALGLSGIAWFGKDGTQEEFSLAKASTFLLTTYGGVAVRRWSGTPDNISTRSVLPLSF